MGKLYVYSTLSAAQEYAGWAKGANDLPRIRKMVRINGGANLADKHLITSKGAVTEISEEDEAFLRENEIFRLHEKNGFVRVDRKKETVDKAVAQLEARDISAPDRPDDFVELPKESAGGVTGVKANKRTRK
ncbi:MAG: hypothetical protein LBF51_07285 [Zoogloeaceae bacterium]|jgi:hypothetical protein|nr:hypothetical protein [Zoogloeaceae bacterium]